MSKIAYQGETIFLQGTTDENVADYEDIRGIVYDKNRNVAVAFSMSGATGYPSTYFKTVATKGYEVLIPQDVTAEMSPGVYYGEVITKFDNLTWTEMVYDVGQTTYIFELRQSEIRLDV